MTVGYLDASAWIKRYLREEGTDRIQHYFGQNPIVACASLGFVDAHRATHGET